MTTPITPANPKVVAWLTSGDTGASSEYLCALLQDLRTEHPSVPKDAADFGRCVRMLERLPELKESLLAGKWNAHESPAWKALMDNWKSLSREYRKGLREKNMGDFNKLLGSTLDGKSTERPGFDWRQNMRTANHMTQGVLTEDGFKQGMPVHYFTDALKLAEKSGLSTMEDLRNVAIIVVEGVGAKADVPRTGSVMRFAGIKNRNLIMGVRLGGRVSLTSGYHDITLKVDEWGLVDGAVVAHSKDIAAAPKKRKM